jgi:hypothetical protein
MRILEVLAAATEFATGSIEILMHTESRKLPWAATLVLVTAVVTEEIAVSLLRLKEAGRRVTLVSLEDDPPPNLPGILVYHIPANASAFKSDLDSFDTTEAALASIPVPDNPMIDKSNGDPTNG